MRKHYKNSVLSFVVSLLLFTSLFSQDVDNDNTSAWEFELTPYIWFAGVSGDISFLNQSIPVNAEFSDVLEKLNFAFMVHFEARKDRWFAMTDFVYLKLDREGRIELLAIDTSFEIQQTLAEIGGGYTLVQGDWFNLDGMAGLRYFGIDNRLDAGQTQVLDRNTNIYDPFIGIRFQTLSDKWLAGARVDLGGFGISSDLSWRSNIFLGYRFSDLFSLLLGVQGYGVDYSKDNYGFNLKTGGIALGFDFRF